MVFNIYEVESGDFIGSYNSNVVPRKGEEMFWGETQFKVRGVYHIIEKYSPIYSNAESEHFLKSIEVEVEIVD